MNTRTLRWFQSVGEGLTLTEVSDVEGVSQPGVSRALARLEGEVGTPLMRKTGRTLSLTPAGMEFKRHVDEILRRLDDGLAAAAQAVDPEAGTVQLAFQRSLATWLVPSLVSSFRVKHPRVTFVLLQVRDEVVTTILETGEADLVVSAARPVGQSAKRQRLMDEPLHLAVSADHPLAQQASVNLAAVSGEPFLMLQPTSLLRQQSERLCLEAGFVPSVAFQGDDLPSLRGFVAAGLGVAIIPASGQGFADPGFAPVHYLAIENEGALREIGLSWSLERELLASSELFRRHVIDLAAAGALPAAAFSLDGARSRSRQSTAAAALPG